MMRSPGSEMPGMPPSVTRAMVCPWRKRSRISDSRGLVEFLVAEERLLKSQVLEEQTGMSGVLRGDEVGRGEGLAGTGGNIGKVSDGCSDDDQLAGIHG